MDNQTDKEIGTYINEYVNGEQWQDSNKFDNWKLLRHCTKRLVFHATRSHNLDHAIWRNAPHSGTFPRVIGPANADRRNPVHTCHVLNDQNRFCHKRRSASSVWNRWKQRQQQTTRNRLLAEWTSTTTTIKVGRAQVFLQKLFARLLATFSLMTWHIKCKRRKSQHFFLLSRPPTLHVEKANSSRRGPLHVFPFSLFRTHFIVSLA